MKQDYIKLADCRKGYLYRIDSRNLSIGVYDGDGQFIGIRSKFETRYLFPELHYDLGPPHGTVLPTEEIGPIPYDLKLCCSFDPIDLLTLRTVKFDRPIRNGGRGWYFVDTNEASESIRPVSAPNQPLFDYLNEWMKQHLK